MREAAARTVECYQLGGAEFFIKEQNHDRFTTALRVGDFESGADALNAIDPEVADHAFHCEARYWNDLADLWRLVRFNPHGDDFDTMMAYCLNRHFGLGELFTPEIMEQLQTGLPLTIELPHLDPYDAGVSACLVDPFHH